MEDALIKNGIDIETYAPVFKGYKVREEIDFIIPSYTYISECYNKKDRFIFHYKHYKIYKDFSGFYDVTKYQILHAHSLFSNGYIAYNVYKRYRIPYIVAVRSTDLYVFFKRMIHLRKLGVKILLNAKFIIFLSISHRNECLEKYIPKKYRKEILKKVVIIPNGIDDFWHKNKREEPHALCGERIRIIFVGNDSKRKNLSTLIDACEILIKKNFNIELLVVGKISEQNKMRFGKKPYIKIKGMVDKNQLLKLYRQSDIFVLPSINETFGLVYPEAMSQGLPVIYTKGQGFDKQFNEGEVGYSVNCFDPNDIASKIIKVINNYSQLSKSCLRNLSKFEWGNIAKQYKQIYYTIYPRT